MIPLLDGHYSAAAVASYAAARIQRCCLSSQVLSPAHLQPGISECRGDSGGDFGDVYTFLQCTFIVVLVGVLVFCVPIPTSHYSVLLLIFDGLFFSNNVRRPFEYSTVGWTLQRCRRRIQRCR